MEPCVRQQNGSNRDRIGEPLHGRYRLVALTESGRRIAECEQHLCRQAESAILPGDVCRRTLVVLARCLELAADIKNITQLEMGSYKHRRSLVLSAALRLMILS